MDHQSLIVLSILDGFIVFQTLEWLDNLQVVRYSSKQSRVTHRVTNYALNIKLPKVGRTRSSKTECEKNSER